jgi:replicative DNA helicase
MSDLKEQYSFDEQFQHKILAMMVRDPKFIQCYEDVLKPTYFSFEILGTLCRLILGYFTQYKCPPTSVAMKTKIMDHVDKFQIDDAMANEFWGVVHEMYEVDLSDGDFIRDKVVAFGRQMAFRQALIKAATIAQEWGDLDQAEQLFRDALATGQGIGDYGLSLRDLPDLPAMFRDNIISRKVRTGWQTVDMSLGGGLGGGEIGFVCAGSGQGKSTILVNFAAVAIDHSVPVIYITHELSEIDVLGRLASRLFGMPEIEVRAGGSLYEQAVSRLMQYKRHLRVKYMNPGTTPAAIRSYISRVTQVDGFVPGMIVDDYADELTRSDRKSYGNRYEDMGIITSELIVLAKDFKCPLWTASQLGRAGFYNENAGAENVSDSFQKIMKADVVLVLNQSREQKAQGCGFGKLDKVRRGKDQRQFPLTFDYERMLVIETPQAAPVPAAAS